MTNIRDYNDNVLDVSVILSQRLSDVWSKVSASELPEKKDRYPYCVVHDKVRPLMVLPNGRSVCEHCGHTSFPNDEAFLCPCSRCLQSRGWDSQEFADRGIGPVKVVSATA